MNKLNIIQEDILLVLATFGASFGMTLIATDFWKGFLMIGLSAVLYIVRTILKIDTRTN